MEYENDKLRRDTSLNNLTFAAAFGSNEAVKQLNEFFGKKEEAEEI